MWKALDIVEAFWCFISNSDRNSIGFNQEFTRIQTGIHDNSWISMETSDLWGLQATLPLMELPDAGAEPGPVAGPGGAGSEASAKARASLLWLSASRDLWHREQKWAHECNDMHMICNVRIKRFWDTIYTIVQQIFLSSLLSRRSETLLFYFHLTRNFLLRSVDLAFMPTTLLDERWTSFFETQPVRICFWLFWCTRCTVCTGCKWYALCTWC